MRKIRPLLFHIVMRLSPVIPKRLYLKLLFRINVGYRLNLRDPKSFNEKIQWLKLNDRNAIYPTIVDKASVKEYVNSILGDGYTFETIGIWQSPDEIDFDKMPSEFVLKTTNGGGGCGVIICKNNEELDRERVVGQLKDALKQDIAGKFLEWPYKYVKPRIIAEPFMAQKDGGELVDYKFHCFNGEPRFALVCSGRYSVEGLKDDFFDMNWNRINCSRPAHPNSKGEVSAPRELPEMIELSKRLSAPFPFLRVDFYCINDRVYVGELTLFPASGFSRYIPESNDYMFGSWLKLPPKSLK